MKKKKKKKDKKEEKETIRCKAEMRDQHWRTRRRVGEKLDEEEEEEEEEG